jgi:hypothetical protein
MSAFTAHDLIAPVTKRFFHFFFNMKSTLLDQSATVEYHKARQHLGAASFLRKQGLEDKALNEEAIARECVATAKKFEHRAMFLRADLRKYQ